MIDVSEHRGLVYKVAARYRGHGHLFDDLIGAGLLGLVEAGRSYNSSLGEFSTHAVPKIRWRMQEEIAKLSYPVKVYVMHLISRKKQRSMRWPRQFQLATDRTRHRPLTLTPKVDEWALAIPDDPEDPRERVWAALGQLDEQDQVLIVLKFGLGDVASHRNRDIAQVMGCPVWRVEEMYTRIRRSLKEILLREEG